METLNLDDTECQICTMNIPVLNDFLEKNHISLARKCSEHHLYDLMARLLKNHQFKNMPEISAAQLKTHFTEHHVSMVTVIMQDIRRIRTMQQQLSLQKQNPSVINAYLRLSRQSVSLLNKLNKIDSFKQIQQDIYQFD